ncbi:synaptonemal complex protein 1-like [Cimex lectularius]|uniref:Uncharacterized protein n=1 Tax=Cimex lectularius TaxID=79782 RepID=A0A8I6RC10_CIMLE|nr:synaptonemal complex protein 1-like [Cimex lectularius]
MSLPNLNLLNFELPPSKHCKYVLTSPRSLKACRKAGIKPVDLLYKSLKDVEKELENKEEVQEKYNLHEKERQRKLGICRRIRNELLIKGYNSKRPSTKDGCTSGKNSPKLQKELPQLPCTDCLKKSPECQENFKNAQKALCVEINKHKVNNIEKFNNEKDSIIEVTRPTAEKVSKKQNEYLPKFKKQKSQTRSHTAQDFHDSELISCNGENEEKQSEKSYENLVKSSLEKLNLNSNLSSKEQMNYSADYLPNITKKNEIVFEDINNNHDVKLTDKPSSRPGSSRKKSKEKKRARTSEHRKHLDNIKLQYSDPEYCLYKYKQVIENSIDREIKEQDVKRVQRQIEEGMERWQDRILLLQWLDSERAQEQVAKGIEVKVERLQQKQRNKEILHTMNINKVKQEEDLKAELLRREIENKNKKIQVLHQEKERVICESKSRAHTVSEIKEQIRNIMTPETFDKKISKYGFAKKVLTPPGMCPRIMQRSHIRLG